MSDVIIKSAGKISASDAKLLTAYTSAHFGSKSPKFVVDDSVIAGVKISGAGKVVEFSLSDLLDNLAKSLT